MVMQTNAVSPLKETRRNDVYDKSMINPEVLAYPVMAESSEELKADENYTVVRFFRSDQLISNIAFDIWNQDGYIGSTQGGLYFSTKLMPGHLFLS